MLDSPQIGWEKRIVVHEVINQSETTKHKWFLNKKVLPWCWAISNLYLYNAIYSCKLYLRAFLDVIIEYISYNVFNQEPSLNRPLTNCVSFLTDDGEISKHLFPVVVSTLATIFITMWWTFYVPVRPSY